MSRYMVNKLMWEVDMTDANLAAFKTDPVGFLDQWETAGRSPSPPYPSGGTLTEAERQAVVTLDFAALYGMGAHPYILWQFARSVCVPERASNEELMASFRQDVAGLGYPDIAT